MLLAGGISAFPVSLIYFLEADTSAVPGAPALSTWTLYSLCGATSADQTVDCKPPSPAFPFDPQSNFGTTEGVPEAFLGCVARASCRRARRAECQADHGRRRNNRWYYETRILFAFLLIALFFAVCSLFLGLFALFSRIGSYLSSVLCFVALIFQTVAAALMTCVPPLYRFRAGGFSLTNELSAAFVEGRNIYQSNDISANLGRYGFAFVWAPMALLLICTILFCVGGAVSGGDSYSGGGRRFGRSRSKRSQRGMLNGDASRYQCLPNSLVQS